MANSPPELPAVEGVLQNENYLRRRVLPEGTETAQGSPSSPPASSGARAQQDPSEWAAQPLSPLLRVAPTGTSAAGGQKLPGRGRRGQMLPNNAHAYSFLFFLATQD